MLAGAQPEISRLKRHTRSMYYTADSQGISQVGQSVGLYADAADTPGLSSADACGDGGVAAAIADYATWRAVAWNQVRDGLSSAAQGALAASLAYTASEAEQAAMFGDVN